MYRGLLRCLYPNCSTINHSPTGSGPTRTPASPSSTKAHRMKSADLADILRSTQKGLPLSDERGRPMAFPRRQDYVRILQEHGLAVDEAAFVADDRLTEAVYLDWLFRPQVGCVFAQLLARPVYRTGIRTVVVRGSSGIGDPSELAVEIHRLVQDSVQDAANEALSVLLPQVRDLVVLADLVWELGKQPGWTIEIEQRWRNTLVLIGLRVEVGNGVVAETLGMGPFDIFPITRQSPVTTLEIRTKPTIARRSKVSETHLATHLADIPISHKLTRAEITSRSNRFTPWLKKRILGTPDDARAKARVTYSIPVAIWSSLKGSGS